MCAVVSQRQISLTRRIAIAVLPTLILLLVGEIGARVYYLYWGRKGAETHKTEEAPSSKQQRTFTINSLGLRGPEWKLEKAPGVLRVLAVGGSATFGLKNPEDATWPVFLEQALRAKTGRLIECLNAGQSGYALEDFTRLFREKLFQYRPEVVVYCDGWNDTDLPAASRVHHIIRRFHDYNWAGRLTSWLYNRSVLYTRLLEKIQFALVARKSDVVPDTELFRSRLEEFVRLVRKQGATPVFVIQMLEPYRSESIAHLRKTLSGLDLKDRTALKRLLMGAVQKDELSNYNVPTRLRIYQTQVLLEVVRRAGKDLGVMVVDPQRAFSDYQGDAALFSDDVVHLSDQGNLVLAKASPQELNSKKDRR